MKLAVILPAAGSSSRFQGGDKLATDLGGRPVLLRTVEDFTRRDEVAQVIVAGPPDDFEAFKERYGAALGFHGVLLVEGGRVDRWETVRNALAVVDPACTHVAVHDAARPLVTDDLMDRLLLAAEKLDAVIPLQPIASTLKQVDPDASVDAGEGEDLVVDSILGDAGRKEVPASLVSGTVDRRCYGMAQTPQIFRREILLRAYESVDPSGATDDAQVLERAEIPVHAIEGESTNIKITTQQDLRLAAALLGIMPDRPARDPLLG